MKKYTWWGGINPPPKNLKTFNQLQALNLYPQKAEGVIYRKGKKPVYLFNIHSNSSVMNVETFKAKHKQDKTIAILWAAELLTREFLILDTETTGLKKPEICQIAIINHQGKILLNTLVRPYKPIEEKAFLVHGISNQSVEKAPSFREIYPEIINLITCQEVVIYNQEFDIGALNNCSPRPIFARKISDPMPYYAMYLGEWNCYRGDYKYPKLGENHDALGDCFQTLEVIKTMALSDI